MFGSPTVGNRLKDYGGVGPGFDFWRFLLSSSIIFLRSFFVCYGRHADISALAGKLLGPGFRAVLPLFFGLSGFLVAGSALRTDGLIKFLTFRALRLVPALAVETTLAALIVGPLFTTRPMMLRK